MKIINIFLSIIIFPWNTTIVADDNPSCRGLAPDCCNVLACGNGTIQSSIITCDTYCVNPNCPTVVNCGKGIIHDSKIICLSYGDQNAHVLTTKTKKIDKLAPNTLNKDISTRAAINLGIITKAQKFDFIVPALHQEVHYIYTPTMGILAHKAVLLTLEHTIETLGTQAQQSELLKLFVRVSGESSDTNSFLASFNVIQSEKKFSDMFKQSFCELMPDGSLQIVPQEPKPKIINIVNALTQNTQNSGVHS